MNKTEIRGGICQAIHQYAKANNKYMRDCDKNKESPSLQYWNLNMVGQCRKISQ